MLESERVKVLVVGDSGVGKTALVHLICTKTPLLNPSFTVGCSLEVKIHLLRTEPSQERPYFVELWDVGGSNAHANTRAIFYQNLHGLMLVYDCTNSKSQLHLKNWMSEVFQNVPQNSIFEAADNYTAGSGLARVGHVLSYFSTQEDPLSGVRFRNPDRAGIQDSSRLIDQLVFGLPILIVGTKVDLLDSSTRKRITRRQDNYSGRSSSSVISSPLDDTCESTSRLRGDSVFVNLSSSAGSLRTGADKHVSFATEHGLPEIYLSCNNPADVAPNSWNAVLLDKFFDDVIITKLGSLTGMSYSPDGLKTRRSQPPPAGATVTRFSTTLSTDGLRPARVSWFT